MSKPVKYELRNFELNKPYQAADLCDVCGGPIFFTITYIDPESEIGDLIWECGSCGAGDQDIVGWTVAEKPIKFMGRSYYPLTARANVGPCVNCGLLVIGVPLILFLDEGKKGELDFCFSCAQKLGILDRVDRSIGGKGG